MRYWDASAIVPLVVRQAASEAALLELATDPAIVTWWGTRIECTSAMARLEREGLLLGPAADTVRLRLRLVAERWHEIEAEKVLFKPMQGMSLQFGHEAIRLGGKGPGFKPRFRNVKTVPFEGNCGLVFAVTAFAYGYMAFQAVNAIRAEAGAQKLGDRSFAAHAHAEARLVERATADLADQ